MAFQRRSRADVGARARPSRDAAHAQGQAALRDRDESRGGRSVRHAVAAGAAWAGRECGRRPAICLVDPLPRLCSVDPMDHRSRTAERRHQHRGAGSSAQRRVHDGAARCVGNPLRLTGTPMAARSGRIRFTHRDRACSQKPPGHSGRAARIRVHIRTSNMAGGSAGSLHQVACDPARAPRRKERT